MEMDPEIVNSASFPQHLTYGEFFLSNAGERAAAGNGAVSGVGQNVGTDAGEDVTMSGGEGSSAAGAEVGADLDGPLEEYPPIPAPKVDGLRFSSHDAAAAYLCKEGVAAGYKMVRPCSATKKDGVAIRQRWLCAKGISRQSMDQRKADLLKRGIAPKRNKSSKKTGCTFSCILYAIDTSKPLTTEWAISLGRTPVHNHPRDQPKRPKGAPADPVLRDLAVRQARLTVERIAFPQHIHDPHPLERPESEISLWERVRILENKANELDYMRQPVCNDWLFHRGNVSFARDRASFVGEYYPIGNGTAVLADGNRIVSVLGIGSVMLSCRSFSGMSSQQSVQPNILHIPAARCNGLSISHWQRNTGAFKALPNFRVVVYEKATKATLFSANDSSGQVRLCMLGESEDQEQPLHLLHDVDVRITADRARLALLAPESGFTP